MKWLAVVASFIFSYSTTEEDIIKKRTVSTERVQNGVKISCLIVLASNTSISNCNGSETNGSLIYIDFHKIRPPCTCTVIPSFEGDIQVTSEKTEEPCSTVVRIEASGRYYYFPCNHQMTSTQIISRLCPLNAANISLSNCKDSEKNGSLLYIDFHKIRPPCACIVIPSFEGDIQVTSEKTEEPCSTLIRIEASGSFYPFPCFPLTTTTQITSSMFQTVKVNPHYYAFYSREQSYHCLGFQQNKDGGERGNIRVFCGDTSQSTTSRLTEKRSTDFSSYQLSNITTVTNFGFHSVNATDEVQPGTSFLKYIIVGISTCVGLGFFALVILLLACRIRKRKQQRRNTPSTGECHTDHESYNVFDKPLPDNPLYNSSELPSEVGYSTIPDHQEGSQLSTQGDDVERQVVYTRPTQTEITDRHVAEIPIYTVPTKPKKKTISDTAGAVYAQVSKPHVNVKNSPVRKRIQEDGLEYIDVDHSNILHAKEQLKDKEKLSAITTYAEFKI
ncbi:uncharacterized protein LOC134265783 [Saccostrea cucullata]|uniref:uncharacterized protein LOC134265783 n=1 Tax=Saccostrea cuccullata TaxID=36930 RepID=UPI002ED5CA73